jgi:hypothetical protein
MLSAWPIDGHESDGQVIRQAMGALLNAAGGSLVAPGGLEVTQKGTPAMAVLIKGGTAEEGGTFIPGYTAATGPYYFQNSASYEQIIAAAGASFARWDTIVARIYDTALDSSGKHEPVFESLPGKEEAGITKATVAGVAAVPKAAVVLAYVYVEKGASKILTEDIKNVATVASLALAPPAKSVGDAQIVSGRQLVETGNAYQDVSITSGKAFELSATRLACLIVECSHSGSEAITEVEVGGVKVGEIGAGGTAEEVFSLTCLVPPGVQAKVVTTGAGINGKYLLL